MQTCLRPRLLLAISCALLALFSGPAYPVAVVFTTDTLIGTSDATYDGMDVIVHGCVLTLDGYHPFNSLTIERNESNAPGVLTHSPASTTGFNLVIATDLTIQGPEQSLVGSRIDASGMGWLSGSAPGGGGSGLVYGAGGGYGGRGSDAPGATGGVTYSSLAVGSGGGAGGATPGGSGGGLVRLDVTGTLTVNGSILANGDEGMLDAGAGSGGAIYLDVNALVNSGTISANGGSASNPSAGGGGGGRITIIHGDDPVFGQITACGGLGGNNGGAGVLIEHHDGTGVTSTVVDNGGRSGSLTSLANCPYSELTITGGAVAYPESSMSLASLHIGSGSRLAAGATQIPIDMSVTLDAVIDAGGSISADGKGFASEQGTGRGNRYTGSSATYGTGGGHAGYGGDVYTALGGLAYGNSYQPTTRGSGGGAGILPTTGTVNGGSGGGCVKLIVTGALTVNGSISANGDAAQYPAGGGAGGSLWLSVGTLAGSGAISANGGAASSASGGGGGGRVCAVCNSSSVFTGTMTAYGGSGITAGGAGTVLTWVAPLGTPSVLMDNGGLSGALSLIDTYCGGTNLTISGRAAAALGSAFSVASLRVGTGSQLVQATGSSFLNLAVTGSATVDAGGSITANGKGSAAEQGTGPGYHYSASGITYGTGAGHGGYGGGVLGYSGGNVYGYPAQPGNPGSGGGNGVLSGVTVYGGSGGGTLNLSVTGTLTLNGSITADGNSAAYPAGGGSGGAVALSSGSMAGAGLVSANGGSASSSSGGGGGGRVAVTCRASSFSGMLSACGGLGATAGGAGTVYTKADTDQYGSVVIDNGGNSGATTPFTNMPCNCCLTVSGKAIASSQSTQYFSTLRVKSGSRIVPAIALYSIDLTVYLDAIIDAGGSIFADGKGYGSEAGTGKGSRYLSGGISYGTGGGYGGCGGDVGTALGGVAYGYCNVPPYYGSGGGAGVISSGMVSGASGGGFVKLNVIRTLTIDGSISANGDAATYPAGGGSGGSVSLTVGTLAGSGAISANGGAGSFASGGGGGGRIGVFYKTSSIFTGVTTAYGGSGVKAGGAGTIYTSHLQQTPSLLIDNGGVSGALTPLDPYAANTDLTINGNAIVAVGGSFSLALLRVGPSGQLVQATAAPNMLLTIGSATIDAGGIITASGKGSAGGVGTGKGGTGSYYGGGGAYGGAGGGGYVVAGGMPYGQPTTGLTYGSGGGHGGNPTTNPGGAGGGYISLVVTGTLTVNGTIAANGNDGLGTGGGGSGGGIFLSASTLAGSGVISANGGKAVSPYAGGGGGGRVCLRRATDTFAGVKTAYGGTGYQTGAAGTVYTSPLSGPGGSLVIDNGLRNGVLSPLDAIAPPTDLTISGKAAVYTTSEARPRSLRLATQGRIVQLQGQAKVGLTVAGNVVIESGCSISADGAGYGPGGSSGPGSGLGTGTYGGGAGYGGKGGNGSPPGAHGGVTYGSALQPIDLGSGGGYGGSYAGGFGGGAIKMTVYGTLTVDGSISANGATGGYAGGAGSGGSIWLIVGSLGGAGTISANGGNAASLNAGGGGGGRICVAYKDTQTVDLSHIIATGGTGYGSGEPGTIVVGQIQPPVIADIPDHYAVTGMPYWGPAPAGSGDMTGVVWSLISAPPDMGIDALTGVVYWTSPTSAGTRYTVTIEATNWAGSTDESWLLSVVDNPKLAPNDGVVRMGGAVVTAVFGDSFYIESPKRVWGVQVYQPGPGYVIGDTVIVAGPIKTNSDFERCVEASSTSWYGSGSVAPIGLGLRSLGGASYRYNSGSGIGQIGVKDGIGLNNIGLLVKTWGRVNEIDPDGTWFVIDDGSGFPTKCVLPDGVLADSSWRYVGVIGISSCEYAGGQINRLIRVRTASDIVPYP